MNTEEEITYKDGKSEEIICKWVLPYIKGRGRMIEKEYNLKKK